MKKKYLETTSSSLMYARAMGGCGRGGEEERETENERQINAMKGIETHTDEERQTDKLSDRGRWGRRH